MSGSKWTVALALLVATAIVVGVAALRLANGDAGAGPWPGFSMVYELRTVASSDGSLRQERQIIQLEWRSESDWKRTVIFDEESPRLVGSWYSFDGDVLTSFDSVTGVTTSRDVESGVIEVPELWFVPVVATTELRVPEWEPIKDGDLLRRTSDYVAECRSQNDLLCSVTQGRGGPGVEETIRESHGIPVAYSDTVGAITITSMSMLSLALN